MQVDAEDLLAQLRADWPVQYELSELRALTRLQQQEIERLTSAPVAGAGSFAAPGRQFSLDDPDGRHG